MKTLAISLLTTSLTIIAAATAQASSFSYVNADGNQLSELCVAAVTSKNTISSLATSMGINSSEINQIACNGQPLMSFVREQRKALMEANELSYSFNHADNTIETDLCIAAVAEPDKFEELKPEYVSTKGITLDKVLCNSQPLNVFIKRYGNPELSAL